MENNIIYTTNEAGEIVKRITKTEDQPLDLEAIKGDAEMHLSEYKRLVGIIKEACESLPESDKVPESVRKYGEDVSVAIEATEQSFKDSEDKIIK